MKSVWPCLTRDIPALPAAIKRRYEDFDVDEIPAYEPCGKGDHVYFRIEKAGLATMRAVNDIARTLGIPSRQIGVAGLKDARAVTRQMLSIEHIDPARIESLQIPRIKVVSISRHGNKLRIGHVHGNRFIIKLRETDVGRAGDVRAVLEILSQRGAPNYFGAQRFGSRGDTWEIGRALLRNDFQTAVATLAGRPGPMDTGQVLRARELFEKGDFAAAQQAWPWGFRDCARACGILARGGNAKRAMLSVEPKMLQFYLSAYQSWLFNNVLAERLDALDRVSAGDIAYKHDNGACFRVDDAAAEAPRAERFEISPTGPLFGPRMTEPAGEPAVIEQRALDAAGATRDELYSGRVVKYSGGRRPLRFRPENSAVDVGTDDAGPFIELRFTLSSGCYATAVLREICKDDMEEGLAED